MDPRRAFAAVVPFLALVVLAGCTGPSQDIVSIPRHTMESATALDPAEIQDAPFVITRWKAPRITVWTDGWSRRQSHPGVSLAPERIYQLEIPDGQTVTFEWSARPMSSQGTVIGYRWGLDLEHIEDKTPRSGPDDVTHWSNWGLGASGTVGPFAAGTSHIFYLEARDDINFISLVAIQLNVGPTAERRGEDAPALAQR